MSVLSTTKDKKESKHKQKILNSAPNGTYIRHHIFNVHYRNWNFRQQIH